MFHCLHLLTCIFVVHACSPYFGCSLDSAFQTSHSVQRFSCARIQGASWWQSFAIVSGVEVIPSLEAPEALSRINSPMKTHRTADVADWSPAYVSHHQMTFSPYQGQSYSTEIKQLVDGGVLHTTCCLPRRFIEGNIKKLRVRTIKPYWTCIIGL